jgi:hypothetical protein
MMVAEVDPPGGGDLAEAERAGGRGGGHRGAKAEEDESGGEGTEATDGRAPFRLQGEYSRAVGRRKGLRMSSLEDVWGYGKIHLALSNDPPSPPAAFLFYGPPNRSAVPRGVAR